MNANEFVNFSIDLCFLFVCVHLRSCVCMLVCLCVCVHVRVFVCVCAFLCKVVFVCGSMGVCYHLFVGRWCLRMMLAAFYVLRPVAHVFSRIEDQIRRTRHMMFPLTLAHVIVRTIGFVRVIADVSVFLLARHLIGCVCRNSYSCLCVRSVYSFRKCVHAVLTIFCCVL